MFYQPSRQNGLGYSKLNNSFKSGSKNHSDEKNSYYNGTKKSSSKTKKSSSFLRRGTTIANRQRWSFLVVLFFFGLSSLIILMSNVSTNNTTGSDGKYNGDWKKKGDEESSDPNGVAFWDVAYEDGSVKHQNPSFFLQDDEGEVNKRTLLVRNIPITHDWQQVLGTKDKFYVYSAYLVNNQLQNSHIRVIGATKTKIRQHVYCQIYDNKTNLVVSVPGKLRSIRENWNLKYSAFFLSCPLENLKKTNPNWISLVAYISISPTAETSTTSTNMLQIHKNGANSLETHQHEHEFTVCVKPMHYNYDNVMQLLEWAEFHRILGVTHFIFYNHTIGDKVSCLLSGPYKDIVQVLPWTLPFVSQKEIRTEGLFAAINDCVYRSRGVSKYLIIIDLDEMVVPRKEFKNYHDFTLNVLTLSTNLKKKIGAFSIQNGFFYLQWKDEPLEKPFASQKESKLNQIVAKELITLRKTRRRSKLHPHKQRSKYIANPDTVVEAGNHFIWEMLPGYYTLSVPSHLAVLHHYRVCEFGGDQCTKNPSLVDTSILKWGNELIERVAQQVDSFMTQCSHVSTLKDIFQHTNVTIGDFVLQEM